MLAGPLWRDNAKHDSQGKYCGVPEALRASRIAAKVESIGGAMIINEGIAKVTNSEFLDNRAIASGGAFTLGIGNPNIVGDSEIKNNTEFIKKLAEKYKIRKLGFEEQNINYYTYKKLCKNSLKLKALTDTIEDLRVIKSQQELFFIKTAVRRAENAFKKLQPFIKVGVTEQKLAMRLEGLLREEGCKNLPFGVIVTSGHMSALPHAKPTSRAIKKGDLVLFDWGGESNGYYSDMTRVVAIKGRHLKKQLEIYDTVFNAQDRAIKAVKPGADAVNVDSAARCFIKGKGYNKYFGHGTGHGLGLAVHERPVISWQSKETIKKGMVFTVEPGIYLPGFGGVRIEDMVFVTGNGAEILTSLPRRLKIIEG